jgi:hypothetical protein
MQQIPVGLPEKSEAILKVTSSLLYPSLIPPSSPPSPHQVNGEIWERRGRAETKLNPLDEAYIIEDAPS